MPLGGSTRAGASATALSTDCYDCHCMPGCRTLYSQKKDSQLSVLWRTRGGVCRRDQWYVKQSAYGMGITLRTATWASGFGCFAHDFGVVYDGGGGSGLEIGGRHVVDCVGNLVQRFKLADKRGNLVI